MPVPTLAADLTLERITQQIVDRLNPARIVLFGSRARGDARSDSDYDLMVEVASDLDEGDLWKSVYEAAQSPGVEVSLVVRTRGRLDALCNDPGMIDWDIARQGVVLWPAGAPPLATMLPPLRAEGGRVREGGETPPESVAYWVARAERDLDLVQLIVSARRPPWVSACFPAQQAAEKYLKALLVQRWRRPWRTHDLTAIVTAVQAAGYDVPDFTAECELLNRCARNARYPEDETGKLLPMPTEAEGRACVDAAKWIVAEARKRLPERVPGPEN